MNSIDGTRTKGLLNMVDLAGSERFDRTGAGSSVDLKNEGIAINQSLTSLGLVIKCLTESPRPKHIPYRSSKLTQILKNSLGGNARTVLLLNCSPVDL
jgi:kinesin family member 5